MFVVVMAASRPHMLPTIGFDQTHHITNLHTTILPPPSVVGRLSNICQREFRIASSISLLRPFRLEEPGRFGETQPSIAQREVG